MNAESITTLDLLRHGKPATEGVFCAAAHEPLSEQGLQDMFSITKNGRWDIIVSSPYARCKDFSEQLARQQSCEWALEKRFQEMDFGDWTGKATKLLWENEEEQFQKLWQTPDDFIAPQGETMQGFIQRVQQGLQDMLTQHKGQRILLVTHAGVIRTILAHALDITAESALKFNIEYAGFSQLHYYHDGNYSLQFHASTKPHI